MGNLSFIILVFSVCYQINAALDFFSLYLSLYLSLPVTSNIFIRSHFWVMVFHGQRLSSVLAMFPGHSNVQNISIRTCCNFNMQTFSLMLNICWAIFNFYNILIVVLRFGDDVLKNPFFYLFHRFSFLFYVKLCENHWLSAIYFKLHIANFH